MIRIFLERLIEWDWPDAPGRNPILHGDIPPRTEPIPRFLTDQQAAAFMAAARAHPVPRYRLVAQVLARTGLRASELCELAADAVTRIGNDGYWLRVPVGKLRNDRMIPMHPEVVDLFAEWTATNASTSAPAVGCSPTTTTRSTVAPCTGSSPASAPSPGSTTCTPTACATPSPPKPSTVGCASKPSPRCSATASLEMTLVYAKITDRVVADEYASVCEQIDALYNTAATPGALPAEIETNAMARLRQESHARMLGNGMCTRPVELDCRMETICETCAYFDTGPEFVPVLLRQRDHARAHRPARPRPPLRRPHHPHRGDLSLTAILRITPDLGRSYRGGRRTDDRSRTRGHRARLGGFRLVRRLANRERERADARVPGRPS